jgi:hypothetical protein
MDHASLGVAFRPDGVFDESATQSGVARSRDLAGNVLEQLVTQTSGVVQTTRREDLRDHSQLARPNQRLQSNRIVLESPCQAHSVCGFRQTVPSKGSDPTSVDALYKST